MIENIDHEFKDVIKKLELLQSVKTDSQFRTLMQKKVYSLTTPRRFTMQFFALRVALIVFTVLASGTGMIAVADQSRPGDVLYPVKQAVQSARTTLYIDTEISKAPEQPAQELKQKKQPTTPSPKSMPTPEETEKPKPTSEEQKPQPTPTTVVTPTPTPVQQSVLPAAAEKGLTNAAANVPLHVNLPIGGVSDPTPTPNPKHDGSKDNGRDAGAGGFLLPKINSKL